jgi:hypothetical protein
VGEHCGKFRKTARGMSVWRLEKFFEELGKMPDAQLDDAHIKQVIEKYGMEYLGPPLFGMWRPQP